MEYNIRLANIRDLDGLCNIRSNRALFIGYFQQCKKEEAYLAIAEAKNNIILGFGLLKLKGSLIPKLSDLYVNENYRGKGVGAGLIKYREEIALDLGFTEIFVSVDPTFPISISNSILSLFSSIGFRVFLCVFQ